MTIFIMSMFIGLLQVFSHQPVSHAESLTLSRVISPQIPQSLVQQISNTTTNTANTTIVGVVPASAFPSCRNVVGGVLYVTRVQRSSTAIYHSDTPSDGPTCGTSASEDATGADSGESLLIVPLTEEGTLSDQPCKVITTPQQYCEIPPGSELSAFPLV